MSNIKYQVYEINSFNILQSKLSDLERDNYLVEITPISNSNGEIIKYFVFAKKSVSSKMPPKKEFENNKPDKLKQFYV